MTDPARGRFWAIQFWRLFGAAIALFGAVVIAKRWMEPAELIGGFFIVLGLVDMMLMPRYLARQWRTPPE